VTRGQNNSTSWSRLILLTAGPTHNFCNRSPGRAKIWINFAVNFTVFLLAQNSSPGFFLAASHVMLLQWASFSFSLSNVSVAVTECWNNTEVQTLVTHGRPLCVLVVMTPSSCTMTVSSPFNTSLQRTIDRIFTYKIVCTLHTIAGGIYRISTKRWHHFLSSDYNSSLFLSLRILSTLTL